MSAQHIYGRHPVAEALRSGSREIRCLYVQQGVEHAVQTLIEHARSLGVSVELAPRQRLDSLASGARHQGIVAQVAVFEYADLDDTLDSITKAASPALLLVLDQIQDPHNLGALIRSALALGAQAVVIPKDRAAEVTGTVIKSSAGAVAHIPIVRVTNIRNALESIKERDIWVYGTVAEGGQAIADVDLTRASAIVIGSEGKGLRRLVAETCDALVTIPMSGALGSLNASVAGAISLYESLRQRSRS